MAGKEIPKVVTTGLKLQAKCMNPECKKSLGQIRLEQHDFPKGFTEEVPSGLYVVPNGIQCPHCGLWNHFSLFGSYLPQKSE